MDVASMDVREKIDLIKERLPRDCEETIVMKFNPFELPVLTILVSKKTGESGPQVLYQMKEVARKVIKNSLEKVEDVASVEIKGGRDREIRVEVDQGRLRASGISLLEVVNILRNANLSYPAGTIKRRFYEYLIRTMGEYKDVKDIEHTPVKIQYHEGEEEQKRKHMSGKKDEEKERPKGLILLSNISKVEDTFKKKENIFRHNDKESISISVKRQSGTNIVKVANRVSKKLKELREKLAEDYELEVIYDQSEFIEQSIFGVAWSAAMGSGLAFLVLLLFMKDIRNSMVVTVAIPASLLGTFILMYFQKISINMMSLGGLALGVGMLVDNSIVVLENIFRLNVEKPGKRIENSVEGTGEVTGAIISSTLTTITVFLPFVFVAGVAGQLFKELTYTVTFSLLTSLFVAITLIPRLVSKIKEGAYKEPKWTAKIQKIYVRFLNKFLDDRIFYTLITAGIFILSIVVLLKINREFMPQTKQNQFVMKVELAPGTQLETTDRVIMQIESILKSIDRVGNITTNIGSSKESAGAQESYSLMEPHQAEIIVKLKGKKLGFTKEVIRRTKDSIARNNIKADVEYITQVGVFGSAIGGAAPISVEIMGDNLDHLIQISRIVEKRLKDIPHIYGVKNSFRGRRPELKIDVNKDRASIYDISTQNVTLTAQTAIKGYVATELKLPEEQVDIRVALKEEDRGDFSKIGNILVRSPLEVDVKLSQIASIKEEKSIAEISRKEGQKVVIVSANYTGTGFSKVISTIEAELKDLKEKYKDYIIDIAGEKKKMQESFNALYFVIGLSLLFVYMIMASHFESLWQPFIIIFTVPLSVIGVAMFMILTSTTLNVVVLLGITMLGGIVVNNGIVLISYFNILKKKELDTREMVVQASATRLRPVLMTAMTTVLGLIPMAVSGGQGAELRAPLAITVIGGLLLSTFLTLFIIPSVYMDGERFIREFRFKKVINLLIKIKDFLVKIYKRIKVKKGKPEQEVIQNGE
jgi:HAE1 family hydrophobic/amphiphilic exporter-1